MSSFRAVLVADTHLGFDLPLHPRLERRRRGEDFFANYHRVLDHVLATHPHVLVHGGDVFFRARVAPPIAARACEALSEVKRAGVPVVLVPGNHDRSRLPASFALRHPNIHVFNEPGTMVVTGNDCTAAVAGFPFARGDVRGRFASLLLRSGIETTAADIRLLCVHQAFAGATVGPAGFVFRSAPDVIPRSILPRTLTAVLAGHIHRSQVLNSGDGPPVFYPGSIERTSFAERGEPKGFFDLTFTPMGGHMAVAEASFIELPARPMIDIEVPAALEVSRLEDFLRDAARRCHRDAVVRLTVGAGAPARVTQALAAPFLRSCFPTTMNVELGRSFLHALD